MYTTTMTTLTNLFQTVLDLDSSTLLLGFVAFILLFTVIRSNRKPSRNLPPGPKGWPILGNLPSLDPKAPYKTIDKMASKYGPVYQLQFGSFPVVILNDFASVRQAFIKQAEEFDDRPKLVLFEMGNPGRGIVRAHSDTVQRIRRRFSLSALRDLGMGKFRLEEQIAEEIERLCQTISRYEGREFSPFRCLDMVTSNVICCLVFGHGFAYDDSKLLRILTFQKQILEQGRFAGLVNFVPWMRYLPGFKKIQRLIANTQAFHKEMVKVSLEHYTPGDPRTFIDMYWDHQEKIRRENADIAEWFDDIDLETCLADLFGAGSETSSTTIKWGLLYMILQPDIQEKVQAELDTEVGRDRMPCLKDRPCLPYTEATLLEIQRIGSIAPLGLPRAATRDTKINEYDVPKGTVVIPNLWAVHHDQKLWDNPDCFQPERFLDPGGGICRREQLIPFGIGKRKCLGEQLAQMELFLIFTHLLHKFTFRLPEGDKPITQGELGMTLVPVEFKLVALPRSLE